MEVLGNCCRRDGGLDKDPGLAVFAIQRREQRSQNPQELQPLMAPRKPCRCSEEQGRESRRSEVKCSGLCPSCIASKDHKKPGSNFGDHVQDW